MSTASTPAIPRPAASVVIVRGAPPGGAEPLEVWMIRRKKAMRFLGGYYAFPGGRVDAGDGAPEALAACEGLSADRAERIMPGHDGLPALAFWVPAARALLELIAYIHACATRGTPYTEYTHATAI